MNLRLALRSLLKTPTVTAVAVISLALGIGANAAIFSIYEQMILRPLPVSAPSELVNFSSPGPKQGSKSSSVAGSSEAIFSYQMFRDLEKEQTSLSGLAGHCSFGANLAFRGETVSGSGLLVSGSYFEVLGLHPTTGRLFGREDDVTPGAHPVAVLSHDYWRRSFESAEEVVGEKLVVNGQPLTIVGVAPQGFEGTTLGQTPDVFVPLTLRAEMTPGWQAYDDRRAYWIYLFGRLAPDVSREQTQVSIETLYRNILREVDGPIQSGLDADELEKFVSRPLLLDDGRRGQSSLHAEVGQPLFLLLAVSGLVLLIACANVANLLLVRAARRSGEIAVRLAIGARRSQLVIQWLGESLLLAVFGAAAGLVVALFTLRSLASLMPPDGDLAIALETNPAFWTFLAVLTLLTGLVGLFPALQGTRRDLVSAIRDEARRGLESRGANRLRSALVTAQIAVSMALLISAGLFARSLLNASQVDLGIETEKLATFGVSPDLNNYSPAAAQALFGRLEEELRALPGVRHVTASSVPMLSGSTWSSNVMVEGFTLAPGGNADSNYSQIGTGYFEALGIPVLAGRTIELGDDLEAPKVAVVNRAFARKFDLLADGDPASAAIGKRMATGGGDIELDIEIVGLVDDAKYSEVKEELPPVFYQPYRQDAGLGAIHFYVHAESGEPAQLLPALRATVARLDPNLPVKELKTMSMQIRESLLLDRTLSGLSAGFAILATLLAAAGLYGVMAYSVAQRIPEIGLRMALGADAARIRRLILRQVVGLTVIGGILGAVGAMALGRAARSLLYGLEGNDPAIFAMAVVALAVVAVGAGLLPAQRASRVEPVEALRHS